MATSYARLLWAMALYFEMRQLLWFKSIWKKAEEHFSQSGTLYAIATMKCFINESDRHVSRLLKKQQ